MTSTKERGPLGSNLEYLRELRGVTNPDIARELGLPNNGMALHQLEKRNSSRSDLAPQLADYFGIDLDLLLTRDLRGMSFEQILRLNSGSKAKVRPADGSAGRTSRDAVSGEEILRLLTLFIQSTNEGRQMILDAARLAPKAS